MKKITLFFAAIALAFAAQAQETYKVLKINNGIDVVYEIPLAGIDSITFETREIVTRHKGHEYVDLGLPSGTLWATCNVGAINPEDYGKHFAWGEISTKEEYSWNTYAYGSSTQLTKYWTSSILEPSDDAATTNWGGIWRMPTYDEFAELISNCTWTWETRNGVSGYKVSSNTEGNNNSIFLPAAGYHSGSNLYTEGVNGEYWSSCNSTDRASILQFGSEFHKQYSRSRSNGLSVRPVCSNSSDYTLTLIADKTMGSVIGTGTYKFNTPITITAIPKKGYYFNEWSDGSIDNPRTIVLTNDSTISATFAQIEGYENGHKYVDLGLTSGTLWATCNVGATSPEEYGDYFAWGETTTKDTYSWSTYKHCDGTSATMIKYSKKDNKTVLDAADDAATANWGGNWRMPTDKEQKELINECTWVWTTLNGVNGYRVTSRKDTSKSIFLPAAGGYSDTEKFYLGTYGFFWSSSIYYNSDSEGYMLYFKSTFHNPGFKVRYEGLSVRPVCFAQ